jgi:hypothetical protein
MKIGILTLPLADNYGGILQAIALYRLLHDNNNEVILIYKEFYPNFFKETLKKIFLNIPFIDFKNVKANNKKENLRLERKKFHRLFIENEIFKISEPLYTQKELEKYIEKENLGAVIVGSDQVWRKQYINDKYYKSYFLNFINNKQIKRIAYAASFGKNHWEGKNDLEDISACLKKFDGISTRELSGIDICKNSFGIDNVKHVLDPTLLIGKDFYLNEIISKYKTSNIQKGGIVTYVLDEAVEKKEIIEFMQNSLDIKKINHLKGFSNSKNLYTIPEWLSSFENADFIITDSFHGMLFSIIFEKNFLIIGNPDRGLDRFLSLLSLIELEDRLVFNLADIKNKKLININYDNINKILDINKKISLNFLINSLNK